MVCYGAQTALNYDHLPSADEHGRERDSAVAHAAKGRPFE